MCGKEDMKNTRRIRRNIEFVTWWVGLLEFVCLLVDRLCWLVGGVLIYWLACW